MKYTDKKENKIFLIYKGAGAKSYMRKSFLIYEEAVSHIWLCTRSHLNFLTEVENFIFFYISVEAKIAENIKN